MAKNQANPDSEIAKFVRAARGALQLTQTEFADKFNCTKGNVSAWEQGRHEPAFAVLNTMASVSGVELPLASELAPEVPEVLFSKKQEENPRSQRLRAVHQANAAIGWPFTLFTATQFMGLNPEYRRRVENEIAGEVLRSHSENRKAV